MAQTDILKDKNANTKIDVPCGICKRQTKHLILSDVVVHGNAEPGTDYQWHNEYQIVQCQGCENISFRKTHSNSEDAYPVGNGDQWEYSTYADVYPNPEEGRQPVEDIKLLPQNLQRIYEETMRALNFGQPVLTGIGIRAIVETVCKDKNAIGSDLSKKINNLVAQGVLTKDGAYILHKLRTLGNEAAHEVKPHENVQLGLALDVIDHLLKGVYILPHHAKAKFK